MPDYHDFVFDTDERRFIGKFDEMYREEERLGFDSWKQDDLQSRDDAAVIRRILDGRRYDQVVDLGCGKGALTNQLSEIALSTTGLDISETAVNVARSRYKTIKFEVLNLNSASDVSQLLSGIRKASNGSMLVVISQVLSYLSSWREILEVVLNFCNDLVIALYLPDDPIGFVKNRYELERSIRQYGHLLEWLESIETRQHVVLASRQVDW